MPSGYQYYDILNLQKDTSADEIKKAYRKLAVQKHPDKGGDPEEFKRISEAYKTLSDPEKRKIYDQLGDEGFKQHEQGGAGDTGDFNPFDLFRNFFGGGMPGGMFGFGNPHGGHGRKVMQHTLNVTMEDVYMGTTRRLRIKDDRSCPSCESICHACGGSGSQMQQIRMGPMVQVISSPCGACNGKGKVASSSGKAGCNTCNGKGKIQDIHNIEVPIPAGAASGEQVQIQVGSNLDLIITFSVANHNVFKRRGNEITMEIKLSLRESFLGKTITIPHFDGDIIINTSDYGIIYDNQKIRIPRKGFKQGQHVPRGDLMLWFYVLPVSQEATRKLALTDSELRKKFIEAFDSLEKQ